MKNNLLQLIRVIFLPVATFIQLILLILVTPLVLIRKRLVKGTKNEFNSDKKELLFGKKIVKSIESLEKAGFPVKVMIKSKYSKYTVQTKDYSLEVVINTDWLGLDFDVIDSKNKILISYSVDTDLYPISQPDQHEFAKEIEDEIVEFLDLLAQHKIKIGTFNGYPAIAIQYGAGYSVRYNKPIFFGKMSTLEIIDIKDDKELGEQGEFITV